MSSGGFGMRAGFVVFTWWPSPVAPFGGAVPCWPYFLAHTVPVVAVKEDVVRRPAIMLSEPFVFTVANPLSLADLCARFLVAAVACHKG